MRSPQNKFTNTTTSSSSRFDCDFEQMVKSIKEKQAVTIIPVYAIGREQPF